MRTKNISELLEFKYGFKEEYSKEEIEGIKELRLDRYDVIQDVNETYFEELVNLTGLKTLTINGFDIDKNIIQIITSLNINNLIIEECNFVDSPLQIFKKELDSLIFNNVIFDFKLFGDYRYKYNEFVNVKINDEFSINTDKLNISRAIIENPNFLTISNIGCLIINENQYNEYKEILGNIPKIVVTEYNEFVKFEVNNNG